MDISAVVAIVRSDMLEKVEQSCQELGVTGITVSKVKGYGESHNFFSRNWMVESVRLEIFTRTNKAEAIATAIMKTAHSGSHGDGIVVVYPIQRLFNIRTQSEATPDAVEN